MKLFRGFAEIRRVIKATTDGATAPNEGKTGRVLDQRTGIFKINERGFFIFLLRTGADADIMGLPTLRL